MLAPQKLTLFLTFSIMLILAAACKPSARDSGLDAVSQDGHWISLMEPSPATPPAQLTLLDLQIKEPPSIVVRRDYSSTSISSFSPDGRYLLYEDQQDWQVMEIASGKRKQVASLDSHVEFLLNDKLLITTWQTFTPTNSTTPVTRIRASIASAEDPQDRQLITDQGQHYFVSQGIKTSEGGSIISNRSFPAQFDCPLPTNYTSEARVIVNADGVVQVVQANRQRLTIEELSKLSTATKDILDAHDAQLRVLLKAATNLGAVEEGSSTMEELVLSAVTGLSSPDGKYLVLISTTDISESQKNSSLDLINLEKDQHVTLSSNTDWTPGFLFSPDSSQILYESSLEGERKWYLAESDGSGKQAVPLTNATTVCWH
jgi:hypothetical protein